MNLCFSPDPEEEGLQIGGLVRGGVWDIGGALDGELEDAEVVDSQLQVDMSWASMAILYGNGKSSSFWVGGGVWNNFSSSDSFLRTPKEVTPISLRSASVKVCRTSMSMSFSREMVVQILNKRIFQKIQESDAIYFFSSISWLADAKWLTIVQHRRSHKLQKGVPSCKLLLNCLRATFNENNIKDKLIEKIGCTNWCTA